MPDFFDDLAFDIPPEAWPVDDVWLSANLARLKIDIYCPWLFALPSSTSFANVDALLDATFSGLGRQELNSWRQSLSRQIWSMDSLGFQISLYITFSLN